MSAVLQRVHRLIALAASPNENEGRNAAVLAVRLIRKHGLVLSMPASSVPGRTTPRSRPSTRRAVDGVDRIRSPLGGECIHCKTRYKAGAEVLWLASGGGLHPHCYDAWSARRR